MVNHISLLRNQEEFEADIMCNDLEMWLSNKLSYDDLVEQFKTNEKPIPKILEYITNPILENIQQGYKTDLSNILYELLEQQINLGELSYDELEKEIMYTRSLRLITDDETNYALYLIGKSKFEFTKTMIKKYREKNKTRFSLPKSSLNGLADAQKIKGLSKKDVFEHFISMNKNQRINEYDMRYCLRKLGYDLK